MSDFTGSNAEIVNIVHTSPSMYIVFKSYFLQMHLYANIIIVVIFQKENDKLKGLMEKDMLKMWQCTVHTLLKLKLDNQEMFKVM